MMTSFDPLQKLAGLSNQNVPQLKSNTHIVSAQYGFGWTGRATGFLDYAEVPAMETERERERRRERERERERERPRGKGSEEGRGKEGNERGARPPVHRPWFISGDAPSPERVGRLHAEATCEEPVLSR